MATPKSGSVAPKERINIRYVADTKGMQEEVELPFRFMVMGDFTGKRDATPIEERTPINVDKDNFSKVMSEQKLNLNFAVKDKLSEEEGNELNVNLRFRRLSDMEP